MGKTSGVMLPVKRRAELAKAMSEHGNATVAEGIGINVHTLRAAAGGLSIHRGTVALIENWLVQNGGAK